MLGLKKRDIKKALKVGAKMGGVSLAEVRADIEVKQTREREIDLRDLFEREIFVNAF